MLGLDACASEPCCPDTCRRGAQHMRSKHQGCRPHLRWLRLPYCRHFSMTLLANLCWLRPTMCPFSRLITSVLRAGTPRARSCPASLPCTAPHD